MKMLVSSGSSIKFWNTQNFKLNQELPNSSDVSSISWNKDGQFLASLNKKNSEISLYTVSSTAAVCSGILRIMDNINCLQFCNTTNRYMAVGGARDSVLIWDVKGNSRKKSFVVTRAGVTKLSFSASDSHLVVGTVQGDAFLLSNTNNLITGPVKLFTEKTKVMDIRYSSLSRSLVGVCAENGGVALMDTNATRVLKEFSQPHTAPASALAFSPINELLMVTVGYDKKFVSYNANCKSIVMTHQVSSPLTSVCFLNNGQCVALGSMTGQIFIFDLRILNAPLFTLSAYEGPVLDLKIKPQGKSEGVKTSKASSRSVVHVDKISVPENQEKARPLTKTDTEGLKSGKSYSPSLELLSPLKVQIRQEERVAPKNTPLLKNFKTPRTSKRDSCGYDNIGILSPIDKENKSPCQSSKIPERESIIKSTVVEGLLSPLHTSPRLNISPPFKALSTRSNSEDYHDESVEYDVRERKDVPQIIDEFLSPVKSDPKSGTLESKTDITESILTGEKSEGERKSKTETTEHVSMRRGRPTSVERVKKDLLKGEGKLMESRLKSNSADDKNATGTDPESGQIDSEKASESTQVENSRNLKLNKSQISKTGNCESKGVETNLPFVDRSNGSGGGGGGGGSEKKNLSAGRKDSAAGRAFEIAFPVNEVNAQESLTHYNAEHSDSTKLQKSADNSKPLLNDLSKMNLELIRSCVSDALERHQFHMNKKFMHMHYTMLKHFFKMKKEMKEFVKEASINEELLAENERLREEIKRLRCTY